jgi:5-methylthioadenosine/S-adenosylhomocysteine deaminase
MNSSEIILAGDYLLTMDAQNRVIPGGAVYVDAGRIVAVDRLAALQAAHPGVTVKKIAHSVLMPGLINAHAHSGFLRGTAEHLPVWDWLTLHINPMHRVLQAPEAEAASWLCYAESVLGGTTTIVDMWRFMDGSAKAAEAIGNRLVAVPYVGKHPDYNYFDTLDMNEALIEAWHRKAGGRINIWVGLEHLFYADAAGQRRAIDLAKTHRTGFHTHCSEAEIELAEFAKRYRKRPMAALDDLGFFETPGR